jgi:ribosomal protein S14
VKTATHFAACFSEEFNEPIEDIFEPRSPPIGNQRRSKTFISDGSRWVRGFRMTKTCKRCGDPMRVVRRLPHIGILPEVVLFRCHSCGTARAIEAERLALARSGRASERARGTPWRAKARLLA